MTSKSFLFSVSPKFTPCIILKASEVASVLLGRAAFVIAYLNEHILPSPGEGLHRHCLNSQVERPSFFISASCIRGVNEYAALPEAAVNFPLNFVYQWLGLGRPHSDLAEWIASFCLEMLSCFLFCVALDYGKQQVVMDPRWRSET